jgi:hypothetical protein
MYDKTQKTCEGNIKTHLGWAIRESRKKETNNTFVLSTTRNHCWFDISLSPTFMQVVTLVPNNHHGVFGIEFYKTKSNHNLTLNLVVLTFDQMWIIFLIWCKLVKLNFKTKQKGVQNKIK